MAAELNQAAGDLLARIPEAQRQAAGVLIVEYGARLFAMAQEDAWQYLRRLMAGDIEAVAELDLKLSNDEFIAEVKTNTARWENVANYNQVRASIRNEMLLRLAPVVALILAGLVGL